MRRHRRIRSGYRSGTKKKSIKKIVIRVLFVIASIIALTALAVLLGAYLKDKAESAEPLLTTGETPQTDPAESIEMFPDGIPSDSDAASIKVCASSIDVTAETPDTIYAKLDGLSDRFNAVSVNVVSDSGRLIYLSEALLNYVGLDPDAVRELPVARQTEGTVDGDEPQDDSISVDVTENINALLAKADAMKLRTNAVLRVTSDVLSSSAEASARREIHSVIVGELYSMGFDEVIITGLVNNDEGVSHEMLKSIVSYLAVLRKTSDGLDIGVTLPASVYLVPQSASIIKSLSEYVDFLAIDISTDAETQGEAYSSVHDNCHSLKGNFSVYNIRGVITSRDADISCAVYTALTELSASSVQFSTYVSDPTYTPQIGSVDEVPSDTEGISNDNANRKDTYTNEAETEFQADTEVSE